MIIVEIVTINPSSHHEFKLQKIHKSHIIVVQEESKPKEMTSTS